MATQRLPLATFCLLRLPDNHVAAHVLLDTHYFLDETYLLHLRHVRINLALKLDAAEDVDEDFLYRFSS